MTDEPLRTDQHEQPEESSTQCASGSIGVGGQDPNRKPSENQAEQSAYKRPDFIKRVKGGFTGHRAREFYKSPMAWIEVVALGVLIWYTHYAGQQAGAAIDAAKSAKAAADIAARQLDVADRPWISAEVTAYGSPGSAVGNGLTFNSNGRGSIGLRIGMTNAGHMAASDVGVRIKVLAVSPSDSAIFELPRNWQKELCGERNRTDIVRYTIFPSTTQYEAANLTFETAGIVNILPNLKNGKPIRLYVFGCVDYSYYSSVLQHQTGFVYEVYGSRKSFQGIQVGTPVQVKDVWLWPYVFNGGNYAY